MKIYINGQGHMTKMATMGINSKFFLKSLSDQKAYDFETWHAALRNRGLQNLYKS